VKNNELMDFLVDTVDAVSDSVPENKPRRKNSKYSFSSALYLYCLFVAVVFCCCCCYCCCCCCFFFFVVVVVLVVVCCSLFVLTIRASDSDGPAPKKPKAEGEDEKKEG
jgi:hypothetical protein